RHRALVRPGEPDARAPRLLRLLRPDRRDPAPLPLRGRPAAGARSRDARPPRVARRAAPAARRRRRVGAHERRARRPARAAHHRQRRPHDHGDIHMTARTVIERYVTAVAARDMDTVSELFAEDATWWLGGELPLSGTWRGRDAILGDFL